MADPYAQIANALQARQKEFYNTNPYLMAAQAGSDRVTERAGNRGYAQVANALLSALQGGLAGYGARDAKENYQSYAAQIPQLLSQPGGVQALAANPEYADIASALAANDYQGQQQLANQMANYAFQSKLQQEGALQSKGLVMDGSGSVKPIPGYAEAQTELLRSQREGLYGRPQMAERAQPAPTTEDDLFGGRLGESPQAKYESTFQRNVMMGMPPGEASEAARQQIAGRLKADSTGALAAAKAREDANKLLDIAQQGRAGMTKAGYTGPGASIARLGADLGSYFSDSLAQQSQGYGQLDSILPTLVAYGRPPGAFTEREWGILAKSGPASSNTAATNAALVAKFEEAAKRQSEFADLVDTVQQRGGSYNDAMRLWNEYRLNVPVFDDQGNINANRPGWQDYFQGAQSGAGQVPQQMQGYTEAELNAAGYSARDIQQLKAQGMVK